MSKSGLLTEDEIRAYFADSFKINIESDVLIRPNRDFVTDIYTRFLDGFSSLKWRKCDVENVTTDALIVRGIRRLTCGYNTGFTFQRTDLLMPTRKRLIAFLNVLIYIRAQVEDILLLCEQRQEEKAKNSEETGKLRKELEQKRAAVLELLAKKNALEPSHVILDRIEAKKQVFDSLRRECEELSARGKSIKNNKQSIADANAIKREDCAKLQAKLDLLNDKYQVLERAKTFKEDLAEKDRLVEVTTIEINSIKEECRKIRQDIVNLDRTINALRKAKEDNKIKLKTKELFDRVKARRDDLDDMRNRNNATLSKYMEEEKYLREEMEQAKKDYEKAKLRLTIKRENVNREMSEKKGKIEDTKQEMKKEIVALQDQVDEVIKKRVDLANNFNETKAKTEALIQLMIQKFDLFSVTHQEAKVSAEESRKCWFNYQVKIGHVLGLPEQEQQQEPQQQPLPQAADRTYIMEGKDRTYIKESSR